MTTAQRWIVTATVLGSGIVFLDCTVVNVALPRIGSELKSSFFATLEARPYVYNGYLLSLSTLLILAGALSDRYGRRRMYGRVTQDHPGCPRILHPSLSAMLLWVGLLVGGLGERVRAGIGSLEQRSGIGVAGICAWAED